MAEILIIEDDLKLRSELEKHLQNGGHGILGCSDAREALQTLREIAFDVIVLDIKLPGLSGTDFMKEVVETLPCHPPLIIITGHGDKQTAIKAVHFGAFDFLEKPFTPHSLDSCIGRALVEKKQEILNYRTLVSSANSGELTTRESEVAMLAAEGMSNEEIASRLQLGTETVKSHLKKIFRKVGVTNRTALSSKLKRVREF